VAAGERAPEDRRTVGRQAILWGIGALLLAIAVALVVVRERNRESAELAGYAFAGLVLPLVLAGVVWAGVFVLYRRRRGGRFLAPELLFVAAGIAFLLEVALPASHRASAVRDKLSHAVAECTSGAMDAYARNPRKSEFPLTREQFRLVARRMCEKYGERGYFGRHDPTRKEQVEVFAQSVSELKAEGKLPKSIELTAPS
jgi:hypothetical protein